MANEINRIGINTGSINNYGNTPKGENKPEDTVVETPAQGAPAKAPVLADDVLTYMANQALGVNVSAPKTYNVSKYVTPEQAERIASFVAGFEDEVVKVLGAIEAEGLRLPEDKKYEIAAAMIAD